MNAPRPWSIRSFRLRLALLSAAVSGIILAVFSSLALAAAHHIMLQRMDEDIREFAHKHLVEPHGPRHWERVDDSLRFFLDSREARSFILLVKRWDGATLHQSEGWPEDLPLGQFPAPDDWGRYSEDTRPAPVDPSLKRDSGPGTANPRERRDEPAARFIDPFTKPDQDPPRLKIPVFSTQHAGGIDWRIGMMGSPELTIVLGLNLHRLDAEMRRVQTALVLVLPVALILVALGAWWISQRALRPIQAVTATIKRVKERGLDQRIINEDADKEFSELIAVFNDLMQWLEKSFHQAIRFSADASHELKTPLTILQAQLEQAVNEAEPGSGEQRRYVAIGKELQRLKSITQKLLLLSRIDAGELRINLKPMNLSQLMEGVVEDTETLAPHLAVDSALQPNLWVMADAELLKQVVQNLASNSIKYNRQGGFVTLALEGSGDTVRLIITNSGPGIPPEDRDKVFTRFYRSDKSRGRRVGGAGLGLSLAREIVRAHHGELTFESSDGTRTVFVMTLPKAESGPFSESDTA